MIFYGGPILTVRDAEPEVEAIAVRGGRIIALGDRDTVFRCHTPRTLLIDLLGRTLMPGFIDSHVHLAWSAFTSCRWLNVSPYIFRSKQEIIAALQLAARRNRPDEWVIAYGYDAGCETVQLPALTAAELDQVSNTSPVFVMHQTAASAYVNRRALDALNAEQASRAASGFVRDTAGEFTGEIRGTPALGPFLGMLPAPTFEQNLADCSKTVNGWARRGCTTIYDAAVGRVWGREEVRLLLELASDPSNPVRFRAALLPLDDLPVIAGVKPGQGNDRISFVGIKCADGFTPGMQAVAVDRRFAGDDDLGLHYDAEGLVLRMRKWHSAGWQLLVHANTGEAIEEALDVFAAMLKESPRPDHRHRIEHCTAAEDRQLARAKQLGVTVSHPIGHLYYSGEVLRDRLLGDERAGRIAPLASEFAIDLVVSLHSDSPATPVEPLQYLETAVTRMMRDSHEILGPEQRVTVDQALKTITLYPAYQCFLEDKVGTLEVGKFADFVILDRNPRTVDPTEISKIEVLETYVGGVMQSLT